MIRVPASVIQEDGAHFAGQTEEDIFQLAPDDAVRPAGPVSYDLDLLPSGSDLLIAHGQVEASFTLQCVVCLEKFRHTCRLEEFGAEFDLAPDGSADLSERIREELLLELPPYPHCDRDGDDPDHDCPRAGQFDLTEDSKPAGSDVWKALDGLDTDPD